MGLEAKPGGKFLGPHPLDRRETPFLNIEIHLRHSTFKSESNDV